MLKKSHKTENKIKANKVNPYSIVSEIYSDLMKEVNYKRWARYIYFLVKDRLKPDSDVLELASGNCQLVSNLLNKNKKIICTDLSKEMLMHSSYNRKVVCDMIQLPFKSSFDLIFSTFDSLNYLLTTKNLLKVFNEVEKLLKPDGIFTFDVSLVKNSYIHEKNSKKSGNTKKYEYKRTSIYDPETAIHKNIFLITDRSGNVFIETHKQKIYDFETYFELIDQSGLYVVNCYRTFTSKQGSADSDRVQFIVKRKKNAIN